MKAEAESHAPTPVPKAPNGAAGFLLIVAAVWLAGQILTQDVADHYSTLRPGVAVLWRGDSADALTRLAQQRLVARDSAGAARLARRALAQSPLDVAALSTLGVALDQAGQADRADRVMTLAGRRGWRDGVTQAWLLGHRLLEGRYAEAIDRADALLRRTQAYSSRLFAVLAALAGDPRARRPLIERMNRSPAWRASFLSYLSASPRPETEIAAGQLLTALAQGPSPPTDAELGGYLQRLVREGKLEEAYEASRRLARSTLPPGEFVHDGRFAAGAGASPFDWRTRQAAGSSILTADAPGVISSKAVRVEYDGVSAPPSVEQLLVLPAGAYRLAGTAYPETDSGAERLPWTVVCADDGRVLTQVTAPGARADRWASFAADFTVPDAGCRGQVLRLQAAPADMRTEIVVWYSGLSVRRR